MKKIDFYWAAPRPRALAVIPPAGREVFGIGLGRPNMHSKGQED